MVSRAGETLAFRKVKGARCFTGRRMVGTDSYDSKGESDLQGWGFGAFGVA